MNIDFSARPGFSAYVLLLMVSGIAMVFLASPAIKTQRPLQRVLNAVFGVGFFGYGFYLAFLFHGGSYVIFFKAFVLPLILIIRTIRGAAQGSSTKTGAASTPYPYYPQSPPPAYPTSYGPPATYPTSYGPPAAYPTSYGPPPAPQAFGVASAGFAAPEPGYAAPQAFETASTDHHEAAGWLSAPVHNGQPVVRPEPQA